MQAEEYSTDGFGQATTAIQRSERRVAEALHYLLTTYPPGKRAERLILDVGCCDGGFTHELHRAGFQAAGLDLPDVIARAREGPCRACRLVPLDIERAAPSEVKEAAGGSPHFVFMSEVIEHLVHDVRALSTLQAIMTPGGRIFVTTPSTPEKIYERDHLRFYPLVSLARLMEMAGFQLLDLGVTGGQNFVLGGK